MEATLPLIQWFTKKCFLYCCADRLLLQRLRKSQSGTALYGESQQAAEEPTEPSVYSVYEGTTSQRLIVVANRLPVSAVKERDGSWSLQVHHTSTLLLPNFQHQHESSCAEFRHSEQCTLADSFGCCTGQRRGIGQRFDGSVKLQDMLGWLAGYDGLYC